MSTSLLTFTAEDVDYKPGYVAYGPYGAETLARIDPFEAKNNADNYAKYANAVWFAYYWGDCTVPTSSTAKSDSPELAGFVAATEMRGLSARPFNSSTVIVPTLPPRIAHDLVDRAANDWKTDIAYEGYDFSIPPGGSGEVETISGQFLRIMPLGGTLFFRRV